MNKFCMRLLYLNVVLLTSCSLVGIQSEEGPSYSVLLKKDNFEIRKYKSYIMAEVTVDGDYHESSKKSFRILAGYIFGKNIEKSKVSMTSPVSIKRESKRISMTSPVRITKKSEGYTMGFSMPSIYTLDTLPTPIDKRITFRRVESKTLASHRFSWFSSKDRNESKARELKSWLKNLKEYEYEDSYFYAGYNPPWTIPFFKRNEVLIELKPID